MSGIVARGHESDCNELPAAIFVTAMDSNPLAADPDLVGIRSAGGIRNLDGDPVDGDERQPRVCVVGQEDGDDAQRQQDRELLVAVHEQLVDQRPGELHEGGVGEPVTPAESAPDTSGPPTSAGG